MKKVLLVDSNNIGYRVWISMKNSTGPLTNNLGVYTTVTFGLLKVLNAFINKYHVDKCIVCWDGHSKYRKKIFKDYKGNRRESYKKEEFAQYIEELNNAREYYGKLGILQGYNENLEADDVIGYLTKRFSDDGYRVIIMSDDKDFFQLSKFNPKFYRPTKMELITKVEAEDKLGYPPKLVPKVVALTGEDKDNIPGACDLDENNILKKIGLGPAKAIKLLTKPDGSFRTLKEVISDIDSGDKYYEQITRRSEQIMMSYKLSRIRIKDNQYKNWELKVLRNMYDNVVLQGMVNSGTVKMVQEYLELRSINMIKVLKNLGVRVR